MRRRSPARPGRRCRSHTGVPANGPGCGSLTCDGCPLRDRCTTRAKGRGDRDQPARRTPAHARAQRWTPEFRLRYRDRPEQNARSLRSSRAHETALARPHQGPEHGHNSAPARSTSTASDDSGSSDEPNAQRRQHPHTRSTTHSDLVVTRPSRDSPEPPRTRKPLPTTQLGRASAAVSARSRVDRPPRPAVPRRTVAGRHGRSPSASSARSARRSPTAGANLKP